MPISRRLIARRRRSGRTFSSSLGSRDDLGELDVGGADDPRRAFADLICGKNAFGNQATDGRGTDRKRLSGFVQRRLAALNASPIRGDWVVEQRGFELRTSL